MNDLGNILAVIFSILSVAFLAFFAFIIWRILRYIVVKTSSRSQSQGHSNHTQIFQAQNQSKLSWPLATLALLVFGIFLILVELPPTNPADESTSWRWGILCLVAAAWCTQTVWNMRYSVVIDDKGMLSIPPNPPNNRINWQEIGRIRNQRLLGRLKITHRNGRKSVRVIYQLENFDYLVTYILQKATDFGQPMELPKKFKNRSHPITVTELGCKIHDQSEIQSIQFESIAGVKIGRESDDDIFNSLRIWFVTQTGDTIKLATYGNEVEIFQTVYYAWSKVQRSSTAA